MLLRQVVQGWSLWLQIVRNVFKCLIKVQGAFSYQEFAPDPGQIQAN